jgi:hypothetical protein
VVLDSGAGVGVDVLFGTTFGTVVSSADPRGLVCQHRERHRGEHEFDAIFGRIKKAGLAYGSAPWSLDANSTIGVAAEASTSRTRMDMCLS